MRARHICTFLERVETTMFEGDADLLADFVVEAIVERIGAIEITSTCGGRHARHSAHYSGKAIDFRPKAVTSRTAVAQLHSLPEARGIGAYSNGLVHADVADRDYAWGGRGSDRRVTRLANR